MPIKLLTDIVLQDFIEVALGSPIVERVSIPPAIAQQIEALDEEESICHIEWPDDPALRPVLWRIAEWRVSNKHLKYKKKLNELERAALVRASEFKSTLAKKIMAQTGLDAQQVEQIIHTIIRTRNTKAADTFGVDLAELTAADKAIEEFKTKK